MLRYKSVNMLDPDQDQLNVGPDLGPNCLQRLSWADDKSPHYQRKSYSILCFVIIHCV